MKLRLILTLILLLSIGAFAQILGPILFSSNPAAAPSVPALVASGVSTSSVSPVTLNTTATGLSGQAATLLTAVVVNYAPTTNVCPTNFHISDSSSNTWHYLTTVTDAFGGYVCIAYAFGSSSDTNPLVTNTSDVFTPTVTYPVTAVYAFSGTLTTSSVYDVSNQTGSLSGSPFQPGSVTPTAGDVCISGFGNDGTGTSGVSVDSGFTGVLLQGNSAFEIVAGAYLLNAANTPLNPAWSATYTGGQAAVIACFK